MIFKDKAILCKKRIYKSDCVRKLDKSFFSLKKNNT